MPESRHKNAKNSPTQRAYGLWRSRYTLLWRSPKSLPSHPRMMLPDERHYGETKKIALYLSLNVFSTKILIGDTVFTFTIVDGTVILRGHPSHAKLRSSRLQCKGTTFISYSYIKTLGYWSGPGNWTATSRFSVKRSTDWAYPTEQILLCRQALYRLSYSFPEFQWAIASF